MGRLLSVIIPALNEAQTIAATLDAVARLRGDTEVILSDGGSGDGTAEIALARGCRVLQGKHGRGVQLHAGACLAKGDTLFFLHADTLPPLNAAEEIRAALERTDTVAGNFGLLFDGDSSSARVLTKVYPQLRRMGLCYGDSGLFVRREVYHRAGGFQPYPIFEDLDLIKRVRRFGRFAHLSCELTTSSRRFEGRSFALTFALWSAMQALYWMGVPPDRLGRVYAPIRSGRRPHSVSRQ
ncbi:MAG: TIGR04283 family arsenosugar biosynthesis glycosyltransferase [Bryobacteraceae bacterium]